MRCLFLLVLLLAPTLPAATLHVYLIGGQSNADGRGLNAGLPTNPVNLQAPQNDIPFYYRSPGYNTGVYSTLRPGSAGSPAPANGAFGPEITFGRTLADWTATNLPGDRIAIIKYARGGTSLFEDWKAGGTATTTGDGSDYQIFQAVVANGLAALNGDPALADFTIQLSGMVWVQGESDVVSQGANASATNYGANLTDFIVDLRLTYGADLPFTFSRLSDNQTAYTTPANLAAFNLVRAGQSAVDNAIANTFLINTDPAAFAVGSDNIHFTAAGQIALGNAFAESVIATAVPEPTAGMLIGIGLTAIALRHLIRRR